ncbi:o-succinylbenzoate--CoA ligase [Virgibacillus halodenitrificans]|uniref:2-succinylbenzoate--CoA ligase n=1 Tax=Virgibacillus halodenitrificans TaxID=1482 RepID=A0AAC9J1N2_VIRHA|nr:o-succinylbenzoate--CoA ligase [Virgibacillus halodenitrificans]APC48897.1 o-succinylbenzoate--CoA ligase [Virgibacillus halodenitrificans]MCG1030201.1 o-succinylbenzoate--CoA ligase [Virgibacillus halodenitrificans]MCJ0933315.1 o-succinylbenzoate--CoA ligase [Virgibacillus halodenitrificans]MEC2161102.1 o-succinylbenzoate--CoA ligase [Virgibacillus halodenitrificans]CDQ30667.1 Long-chain-fatty-acid--CoA ligase FadD13 [Virgibacillus halodenitrificans]
MEEIIPHWLNKQASLAPSQVAIEELDGSTLTFLQLQKESSTYARKLASWGITEGSHVGILSTNCKEMVIAIHALSYLGAVAVLLNTRLTIAELNFQLTDAEISFLLTEQDKFDQAKELQVENYKAFSALTAFPERNIELVKEIKLNKVFTIIYTSGTTGHPKGVVHTYGNHWWSAIGSALNLGINPADKWLAALPIFHVSGLSILIRSVVYGMPVFLLNKFDAAAVHDAIMNRNVTMVSVVTIMLQQLLNFLQDDTYPKSFRCMLLGGGPAPKPLLQQARDRNIPVFQSFGMTETASQIVTLSAKDALQKVGSAGKPLLPAQLKINNPNEESIGEIYVKGPMITKGYYKNNYATENAFIDGWLATGDLGYLDSEDFLYVVDRRADLIISGGENIYPSELESVLSGMKQIKEIAVIGMKDSTWGEVPVAFIVTEDELLNAEEVLAYAESHLAKYKLPREIIFVKELPRNASNKIVRKDLYSYLPGKEE